jgi:hypothetical protein
MTVNDTTGWQVYQTLTKTNINISAGQHELRWAVDSTGSNGTAGNHNYFIFTATSTNPPPVFVQSTATLGTSFADESSANVNLATKIATVPQSTSSRFYRLRSTIPTQIMTVNLAGTNVVIKYQ